VRPDNATHIVRGYAGRRHPSVRVGELLVETWHVGDGSMQTEVVVWRMRMKKGECSRVEVIDLRPGGRTEVIT
jgi:hypothetical protein